MTRNSARMLVLLGVGVMASVLFAACGMTRVNAGNVGIKINYSGTYRGVQDIPLRTGWVFATPLASTVFEYPTFVQNIVWTHSAAEGNPVNEEITFTNADQMAIAVDVSVAYHLESDRIPAFYLKFRNDDLKLFTLGFMRNVARDQFNAIAGRYHMDQIMGDNGVFVAEVRAALQKELAPYGVVIDQFGIIGAPRPPQSVLDSITIKVKAQQIAIQKQNEVAQAQADADKAIAQARGEGQSEIIAAESHAKAMMATAEASAYYNRKINDSLTPLLMQYRTVDKWDGVLPTITGGSVPMVQLPQVIKK